MEQNERLYQLSTPLLADACMRLGIPVRCAPSNLQALEPDMHCVGRVCPVRHAGSVDIFQIHPVVSLSWRTSKHLLIFVFRPYND